MAFHPLPQAEAGAELLADPVALERQLRRLLVLDPRLKAVAARAAPFGVRKTAPGFAGMARVICGQQLSVASAAAIWSRFAALPGALDPASYLRLEAAAVRATGFSAGKYLTVRAVAEALVEGQLDLDVVAALPAPEAVAALTAVRGIGPWTAEIYLMFCAGHADIFPAGDLALQKAVAHALALPARPTVKELAGIAAGWSPYRHAAALLFWGYYAAQHHRKGQPL